jgi:heavy metal sensor kinase
MISIRLSLVVYFLVLLTLALGAGMGILYQVTARTLQAKEESTQNLLRTENKLTRKAFEESFDTVLLRKAQTLASQVQSQWGQKRYQPLLAVGMLGAPLNPHGGLQIPLWLAQGQEGPVGFHLLKQVGQLSPDQYTSLGLFLTAGARPGGVLLTPVWIHEGTDKVNALRFLRKARIRVELTDEALADEEKEQDYFQVYNERGVPVQWSHSLGDAPFTLNRGLRDRLKLYKDHYDNLKLQSGVQVRRVTLKVPVSSIRVSFRPPGGPGALPPRLRRAQATPPESFAHPVPAFFIQYAIDTSKLDESLRNSQKALDDDFARLKTGTRDDLVALREILLYIGLATLVACMGGGFWLIRLGLAPLRRLSEAVSRVSERDFRIALDASHLPPELRPILHRLNVTLDQLRRAFAREKQAAADISHELRTPLAALLTTLEVGLRRPRTPEHYADLLRECQAIGLQMTQLVERLLALARMDAGADSIRSQQVDVAALAGQCVALVRPLAEARTVSLDLHTDGPATVTTDPVKLREVIINLLHNAVEYNRPNGRIEVSVGRSDGHLRVAVRDTGIGIPAKALGHVFERFYRVDESRAAEGLHAGVGLAIVKGYLDLMGGSVAVQSTEGEGSTFTVQLPAR